MLDLFVMVPSIFSGATLWLIIVRWLDRRERAEEPEVEETVESEETILTPTPDALAMLEVFASRFDPPDLKIPEYPLDKIPSISTTPVMMLKCNCGLEFPEDLMSEHAQSTGHSKPFDQTGVRIAKIWDLEEAVIETASPDCVKCGKPVPGLKRIGKTIYVTHLGCAGPKDDDGKLAQGNRPKAKSTTCSICWKSIDGRSGITSVDSLSGSRLMFHEDCLKLQSRSQLFADDSDQRYRRIKRW